jgi:hypothetical protein
MLKLKLRVDKVKKVIMEKDPNGRNNRAMWSDVRSIASDTGSTPTAHGIPNILANTAWSFKLMWLACFLSSFAVCCWLLTRSVHDYLEYKVVTTIKRVRDKPGLFPTVTLCNTNFVTNEVAYNYIREKMTSDLLVLNATADLYEVIR